MDLFFFPSLTMSRERSTRMNIGGINPTARKNSALLLFLLVAFFNRRLRNS